MSANNAQGRDMSAHSPGPWRRNGSAVVDAKGDDVCDLIGGHDRYDADARLIAAAPELLRELTWIVQFAEDMARTLRADGGKIVELLSDARTLIRRIEGEP